MSTIKVTNIQSPDSGTNDIIIDASGNVDIGGFSANASAPDNSVNLDSSGRLLVGLSTARSNFNDSGIETKIQVEGAGDNDSAALSIIANSGTTNSDTRTGLLVLGRTRGTAIGSNTAVAQDDAVGMIEFKGNDGAYFVTAATIKAEVDGTPGTDDMPGRLVFSTTADAGYIPTERMRITSAGKFKFSDSGAYISAAGTSHEFRNGSSNNIIRFSNTNATPYGNIIEYENAAPNSTGQEFLVCQDTGASRFRFRSNGGLANFQSNDANLCDEREKKNIETLDSTWGCLKNWDLKKFHYNEDADTDDKRYGVIAQQVAEHCPEVITDWVKQEAKDAVLDEDGNVVTPAVEEVTRMGVKEQQMMWMAIKALQEAQTRIETLEAEVAALKAS